MTARHARIHRRVAGALVGASIALIAGSVLAQTIPVTTPRLAPRGAAAAQGGGNSAGAAAPQNYSQNTNSSQGYAQSQGGGQYAGAANSNQQRAAAPVIPERAKAGACRAVPTPDRQTITLVSGDNALARAHLPLGEFRAVQVVHSPDAKWAVAMTKLRGAEQYALLTLDLTNCEMLRTVDLPSAADGARFDGEDVFVRLGKTEKRLALRDGRWQ